MSDLLERVVELYVTSIGFAGLCNRSAPCYCEARPDSNECAYYHTIDAKCASRLAAQIKLEVAREFVDAVSVGQPDLVELPLVIKAVLADWKAKAELKRKAEG